MSEPLRPYRFEPPVDDGASWDAGASPAQRRDALRRAFDALAREPEAATPPGISALTGADPAARAAQLGYAAQDLERVPAVARRLLLGLGHVVPRAALQPGQVVIDVGCGGGLDAHLAAWRVGPEGRVEGLDLSGEMIARAREVPGAEGQAPMTFRVGLAEALPYEDACADRVLANCVLSLVPDRARALREARRVLRPGGWLVVGDGATRALDPALRGALSGWGSALGDAPDVEGWRRSLASAGLDPVEVEVQPLGSEVLLQWAQRTAGVAPGGPEARVLRDRLAPLVARLADRLATVTLIGRAPRR